MSKKVLVVGSGILASVIIKALERKNIDLHVSIENQNIIERKRLLNCDVPFNYKGLGGLGNLWHNVIDLSFLNANPNAINSAHQVLDTFFNIKEKSLEFDREIVPYIPYRPSYLIKKQKNITFQEELKKIEFKCGNAFAKFIDGQSKPYDHIFLCCGALNSGRILQASELGVLSGSLSDHLVGYSETMDISELDSCFTRIKRGLNYHSRKFEISKQIKSTYRPAYGSDRKVNIRDKGIYLNSAQNVVLKLLKSMSLNTVRESLYLRYGIGQKARNYHKFIQFACEDVYTLRNNEIQVNDEILANKLNSFKQIGQNYNLNSIVPGIHFYNSLKTLDNRVSNFKINSSRVALFAPSFNYKMTSSHHTFEMMVKVWSEINDSFA